MLSPSNYTSAIRSQIQPNCKIIATGGGAILSDLTRQVLQQYSIVVYLKANIQALVARLQQDSTKTLATRPLLRNLSATQMATSLEQMLAARASLYQEIADITVDTCNLTLNQTVQQTVDKLMAHTSILAYK
jgi:shikimate kinase